MGANLKVLVAGNVFKRKLKNPVLRRSKISKYYSLTGQKRLKPRKMGVK